MGRLTRTGSRIAACSLLALLACGCNLTLGPRVEKRLVVLAPGVPVEILENRALECRVLTQVEAGEVDFFQQDVGGWVAMPPAHWQAVKAEIERLRAKAGE